MIHVYSLYDRYLVTDITSYVKTLEWSGDLSQCARKVDCTLAYSIFDKNQPHTQIGPGTLIWIIDDDIGEFFRGIVFDRELSSSEEITFTAYDYLIYFLKSKGTYNFNNIFPEDIAKKICQEAQVEIGHLEATNKNISMVSQGQSFYDIIMKAYSMTSSSARYFARMKGSQFEVIPKGQVVENYELRPDANTTNVNYSDNIESMVNRVKIFDDKNNYLGTSENKDWITEFGVLQDTYTVEEGKNPSSESAAMLHGVDTETTIEALGNMNCITGFAVKTKIWYMDILKEAVWYIDEDTHTFDFSTGKHTMELTLHSENTMDIEGE